MTVRFYIDPATGEPHIYGHSVVEEEVRMPGSVQWRIVPVATGHKSLSVKPRQVGICA